MSVLFEANELGGIKIRNRFIRSATWEGMAEESGACTQRLIDLMKELALGEVGLIITSHAYVRKDGQAGPWQLGMHNDGLISGLSRMTDAIHSSGGKIIAQLSHSGFFANPKLTGEAPICMSVLDGHGKTERVPMSIRDIQSLVQAFAQAGLRAKKAGFDGIQIHAAHGYLLSQSLSPAFNLRDDAFGGTIENRARFLLEVIRTTREFVGEAFPIFVKINCSDFLEKGLELNESLIVSSLIAKEEVCAIELSGGTFLSGELIPSRVKISSEEQEAYFRQAAKSLKSKVSVPVILVGGIRSLGMAEKLVENGYCDFISMCRPFIREPGLIGRWKKGDTRKAACLSDNLCFGPALAGEGIYCVIERRRSDVKQ
ncbi:MAG: NADH:flavin oxidoreductase [Desulfobacteraceae bacterium]|jgi:2,4-dienoyl-CoA reductase-like NADH-dependent reductase (Old Yellow Enzyme family)|nr:MAG: NADH:flavin oxidoreductase [Desulfobacteraceae bacterium]